MENHPLNRWEPLAPFLIFLLAFGFALLGVNPTFYLNDSPETTTACLTMGIPHPPGYPFFGLLGHCFSGLPLGHYPFRINLFSAVLAASVCAVLFFLLRRRFKVSFWLAATFSLLWIVGATAYPAALSAKTGIYHLTALFLLATLWALLEGRLGLAVFLLGFSFTNHWMSMVAFLPGFALLVYFRFKGKGYERIRPAVLPALFFLGLSVYLLLPLRAHLNPALNWGNPSTWHNFVFNFLRKQYSTPEAMGGPGVWFLQWWAYLQTAFWEFDGLFLLALFGIWKLYARFRNLVLGIGLAWLSMVLVTGVYLNLPESRFYLINDYCLSAHVFILIFSAWVLETLLGEGDSLRRGKRERLVLAGLVLLGVALGFQRYNRDRQTDYTYSYDFVLNGFKSLPRNALFFGKGDSIVFPCWYFQWIEGKRPDVAVIGVDGLPMEWIRKNLAVSHPGLKVPFTQRPLGNESISSLAQWIVDHNSNRELYFSYNKIEDGTLPGTRLALYGIVAKGFPPGQDLVWDEARASRCWDQLCLRHLGDPRFPLDPRTAKTLLGDYAVFRNSLGLYYEDRADDAKAKLGLHSKAQDLLNMQADYQKSYDQYHWAEQWSPDDPLFAFNTGNALYHLGRFQESTVCYEKAVELDPKYTIAYFNGAVAALQLQQNQRAGELFQKALDLKPDYPEARKGLDFLVKQGLYKKQF